MRLRPPLALSALLVCGSLCFAEQPPQAGPTLGLLLEAPPPPEPLGPGGPPVAPAMALAPWWQGDLRVEGKRPLYARVSADWGALEREDGAFAWERLAPHVDRLWRAGFKVVVQLGGRHPSHVPPGRTLPEPGPGLQAWLAFARSAVRTFGEQVAVYEIGDSLGGTDADAYAFFLKNTALGLRAEAKAAGVPLIVAQAAIRPSDLDQQRALWGADLAAYVDVLPVRIAAGEDLQPVFEAALQQAPAPEVWAYVEPGSGGDVWADPAAAVHALSAFATAAFFRPAASVEDAQLRWATGVHRTLSDGFGVAPAGAVTLEPEGEVLGRFVRESDLRSLIFFRAPGVTAPDARGVLRVDVPELRGAVVREPIRGAEYATGSEVAPGGGRRIPVFLAQEPLAVLFDRAIAAGELETERQDVGIQTVRGLTAEEIIARHQEVQRVQDDALRTWTAKARIDFHYRLAQGAGTVDVGIDANYFWHRGEPLEWEQTAYYVNGNRITWKEIPELPLIQPEKVVTLPLDLTLDRTYAYRLSGEDRVDGKDAYVLSFEPAEGGRSLYRGRVWIDKATFVRLKLNVLQTNLEAPVVSNEETDFYRPVTGPEGRAFWLLTRVDGQQHWTVGGRNLIVRRQVAFETFEINAGEEAFARARSEAYARNNRMLRDTEEGQRYLERQEDGTRTVKQTMDTSQLFAAAGVYKDQSTSGVVPLGGVNWFDFDLFHRGVQANVFFAGVLAFFNFTKPDLFQGRSDATVEGALSALKTEDKVFAADQELTGERVRVRSQFLSARYGIPLGQFFKVMLVGSFVWNAYDDSDEARDARAANPAGPDGFVLPADHTVRTGRLEGEFNRKGYTVSGSGSWSSRSEWEPWGPTVGGVIDNPGFDPDQESFSQWGVTAFKEWYLPRFQKLRGEVNWLDGRNLDRFSQYQFSFFGDTRLNGFAGSGVRFDRAGLAHLGYSFNLFGAVRFDASLESADVERRDSGIGSQRFSGVGLSANFPFKWKTVWSLSYGRAVQSDIPELRGDQEFLFLVLKLF
ncbi:MAG TPA: sigma-E factor regulatory protein RseB domain-containing protein [Candidatus Polarisedimenticolaceae bacterium]|nr:sigma-E factor regulatory protein RseB domain-containing protein [Candidatus Polarisedimenticolaceae bacterium]